MTASAGRRRGLLVLTFLLTCAVLVLPASPASAQGLEPNCRGGQVCVFRDVGYGGGYAWWTVNERNYAGKVYLDYLGRACPFCGLINDTVSALDNDGYNCGSRHFIHSQENGRSFWLPRTQARSNIAAQVGPEFNDSLSSHQWC